MSDAREITLRPPTGDDFDWIVERHGSTYREEYGWNEEFERLVARIVADYRADPEPCQQSAWIAEVDGERVGCIVCARAESGAEDAAQLRILLVEPRARGLGIGRLLVETCVRFARDAGYRRLTLWTDDSLVSARRIYESVGFRLVREEPHHSFGHDLVGQFWELEF